MRNLSKDGRTSGVMKRGINIETSLFRRRKTSDFFTVIYVIYYFIMPLDGEYCVLMT
jgi:hypothetical protein